MRILQFARTSAIDPTTATTYKDPTQLGKMSTFLSQTAMITQQLGTIRAQFRRVQTSGIHTLCDKCVANPLSAIHHNICHMNIMFGELSLKRALTLEVDKLRNSHAIPQNEVEYLDACYWPSPDVLHFIPKRKCIVINKHR